MRKVLPKNQHTQKKLLNFKNWINGGQCNLVKSSKGFSVSMCKEMVSELQKFAFRGSANKIQNF